MRRCLLLVLWLFVICACRRPAADIQTAAMAEPPEPAPASTPTLSPALGKADRWGYRELDWSAMLPADELAALERGDVPQIDHDGTRAMPQFGTFRTVDDVVGQKIRLPGYLVPLDSDDAGKLSEFLFVPYLGACIHVPPPPPNQIVHVKLAEAIDPPDMYAPLFLSGHLQTQRVDGDLAGSAYAMLDASLRPYEDD